MVLYELQVKTVAVHIMMHAYVVKKLNVKFFVYLHSKANILISPVMANSFGGVAAFKAIKS